MTDFPLWTISAWSRARLWARAKFGGIWRSWDWRGLSGGMRRRVVISRAVCFGADLLLLDEPFKGLDDEARQQTADYILRHRGAAAILCVTHDREDAAALGGADIVTF